MPAIDTNKVRDIVGMRCVIQTLDASQRKGKCQDQLQWYSMWRTPTWYNNALEAGVGSLEAGSIYSANDKKMYDSTDTNARRCFSRLVMRAKRRMVLVRRQDEALTVNQLLLIGEIAEEDWSKSNSEEEKK